MTTEPHIGPRSESHSAPERAEGRLQPEKFRTTRYTADGSERAFVDIEKLETLWFNTGSLCNIECRSCYMESSPANDWLEYLTSLEVHRYLEEIEELALPVREIAFTGGEPFMNPDFLDMVEDALARDFEVLVLTNAMRPMMRPGVRRRLLEVRHRYGDRLHLRVSLDHFSRQTHDSERGRGSWSITLDGLRWLAAHGFRHSVAGRTKWGEREKDIRDGFRRLFGREGIRVAAEDPGQLVLFPEMDSTLDVPEITIGCWSILGKSPSEMMCARSRMVLKRKGAPEPVVVACTLLPYGEEFELGRRLEDSLRRVWLNHPHCARFCALGGGSCSVR